MINIYHTETQALVADEHLKVFYYVTKQSADNLAQGVKCTVYENQTLGKTQEFYERKGYEEVRVS